MELSLGEFALDLYSKTVIADQGKNVFMSPWSIYSALSLLLPGSAGETLHQTVKGLHLQTYSSQIKDNSPDFHEKLATMLRGPLAAEEFMGTISLANKMYLEQSYDAIKESYIQLLNKQYQSELGKVSFATNPDAAISEINGWVEKNTNHKIKNLVDNKSITKSTRIVLINAVHFKAKWSAVFKEKETKKETFHCLDKSTKEVNMMHHLGRYALLKLPQILARVLWIPFFGERFHLVVILPDDHYGLTNMQEKLTSQSKELNQLLWKASSKNIQVDLKIPRVHLETKSGFKNILSKHLGMPDMFDAKKVNLSGITSQNDFVVDDIIHQAFFDMNEEGVEAAAATKVNMLGCCRLDPKIPENFHVDHPFMFAVCDSENTMPLFLGHVVQF